MDVRGSCACRWGGDRARARVYRMPRTPDAAAVRLHCSLRGADPTGPATERTSQGAERESEYRRLVDRLRAGGIPLRLRHRRHLRRRKNQPEPLAAESGAARRGDGLGPLRHRDRRHGRRLADRPARPPADALLDRHPLFYFGGLERTGHRRLVVHRRPVHRRARRGHLDRRGAALHLGDLAPRRPRPAGGDVPVQHRARHPRRFPLQLPARGSFQ